MKLELLVNTREEGRWRRTMHMGFTSARTDIYSVVTVQSLFVDCASTVKRVLGPSPHTERYTYRRISRHVIKPSVNKPSLVLSGRWQWTTTKSSSAGAFNETSNLGSGILKILKTSASGIQPDVFGPRMTGEGSSYCNKAARYLGNLVTEIHQGDAVFSPTMLEQKRTKSPVSGLPIDGLASSSTAGRGKLY